MGAVSGLASLVWLPSGISLTILFLSGLRLFPAILLAAFLVNLTTGAHMLSALLISIGNTFEVVLAVILLRRIGFNPLFIRVKDVYFFIFAITLGASVSSTIGTTSLWITHTITFRGLSPTFGAWLFGDFMSMLILTPFLLTWIKGSSIIQRKFTAKKFFEALILTLSITLLASFIYWGGPGIFRNAPKTYLIFPFLIWTAMRFGIQEVTAILFLLFVFAASGSILDVGPFADSNIAIRLALVHGFLTIAAITTLILATVNNERREFDRRKDNFISMASHELKTPLTSAKILIQVILKQSSKNTKTSKLLRKMNVQIDKLSNLINDLLDVTKIEQGKLELRNEVFLVKPVVKEIIDELKLTTDHQLIVRWHTKLYISADKQRFHQIITNLVMNAIKFSPPKSKIIISSKKQGNFLVISVQDFGIGIPDSEIKQVFSRFYQINSNNRDTYPGIGLGLFIVKEIISRLHGTVWVESEEGKGSTFSFNLPIVHKKTS